MKGNTLELIVVRDSENVVRLYRRTSVSLCGLVDTEVVTGLV